MKQSLSALVMSGFALAGTSAMADDSMSRTTMTDHQALQECIAKQKTADVTMSKAEMKRICKDQLKQQKLTGTPMEAPPTDMPHN